MALKETIDAVQNNLLSPVVALVLADGNYSDQIVADQTGLSFFATRIFYQSSRFLDIN